MLWRVSVGLFTRARRRFREGVGVRVRKRVSDWASWAYVGVCLCLRLWMRTVGYWMRGSLLVYKGQWLYRVKGGEERTREGVRQRKGQRGWNVAPPGGPQQLHASADGLALSFRSSLIGSGNSLYNSTSVSYKIQKWLQISPKYTLVLMQTLSKYIQPNTQPFKVYSIRQKHRHSTCERKFHPCLWFWIVRYKLRILAILWKNVR